MKRNHLRRIANYCLIKFIICLVGLSIMTPLTAEKFDLLEFSSPSKYGWTNEDTRLAARDSLFIKSLQLEEYYQMRQRPWENALKTAVAPGWGHFSLKKHTKGQILLGAQIGLLGTGLYFYEKSMIDYRKYKKASQIDEIDKYYEAAIVPYRQANLLFGLFAIVWGYTIYDVIMETNSFNYIIWDEITKVSASPNGIKVEF